ncbi:MAG: DinB family protein [Rubrivivax sp.]|nr:DinB family protein [Rubrivivax sp.]
MSMLHTLLAQKSWSDTELLDRLATVTAPEHAEVLHMAVRMLNHIHVVDRIFQAHLQGEPHAYTATNTEATPGLAELQFAVAEVDGWYLEYAARVSQYELQQPVAFRFTDGDPGTLTREEMLLHVVTHGAYHRGNVGQMLKSIGVAPPRDLLTRFLHTREPQRRWV